MINMPGFGNTKVVSLQALEQNVAGMLFRLMQESRRQTRGFKGNRGGEGGGEETSYYSSRDIHSSHWVLGGVEGGRGKGRFLLQSCLGQLGKRLGFKLPMGSSIPT